MEDFYINQPDKPHLEYVKNFYPCSFDRLYNVLPLKKVTFCRPFFLYRRPLRKVCAFSDVPGKRYYYSAQYTEAVPWHPLVKDMKRKVDDHLGVKFNFALVNYYPDGRSGIGKHSDNESSTSNDKDCSVYK